MWKSPLNIAIIGNRTSLVRLDVVNHTVILPLSLYTFWAKFPYGFLIVFYSNFVPKAR